jgi:hypothetical protein
MSSPPGGFEVTIGGDDYTEYVDATKLHIESNLAIMLDTCDLTVAIKDRAVSRPLSGDEIIVTSNLGIEFGGIAVNVQENQPGVPRQYDYIVKTRDYSFLLDRHDAYGEFAASTYTYDEIVINLVETYGAEDGFTTHNVQASFQAPFTRFDYQPVAQSINLLAQQIAWGFYIDYSRDVHFFDTQSFVSPLPGNVLAVDTATTIPDATYGQLGVYGDLQLVEDITQLRNRVYLYGHKVAAIYFYPETFTGDGQTLSFGLTYEPSHTLPQNVVVTVGGSAYTVAADLADGSPDSTVQDFTAYIDFQGQTVRFNVPPANGLTILVDYKPMFPLTEMVQDASAQAVMAARIGGMNDGVFEYSISDPTLSADTVAPAVARGQEQITKYGRPHITGQFTSYLHGWRPGQFFTLSCPTRFDGELDGQIFYVTKVAKDVVSHPVNAQPLFVSTVSFSDSIYVF